ncbi:MAG TPA: xanthine dehydrogenase family protein molybdopterin-binding subunit [Candidatus Acidoferrales bacterium]|jgi:carbon-monoxide dehydrogenase large subunit|nr:xanthine dehydrogenase family protein molybdopterin-binding subunit [Candidatus Acidoferrales bacterium]
MADVASPSVRPGRSYRYAGKPIRRAEDADLLRGAGGFLADIPTPDAAEAFIVRSTHAHALIRGIRSEHALKNPGVIAVFTAADLDLADDALPCLDMLVGTLDVRHRVMAKDRVRYVGQPVALIVALNRYLAEDAAALVEIDYENLPAVTDHLQAIEGNAPLLYPEYGTNIVYETRQHDGNSAFVAREGDLVIRKRFEFHRQTAVPMENRGVIAKLVDKGERIHVESTTQIPHTLHTALTTAFGMDASQIRVTAPRLGGGFGCKEMVYPEEIIVPAVALKLKRPVRWSEDRREYFGSAVHGREETVDAEAVVGPDGVFVGLRLTGWANIGAAFGLVPNSPITAMAAMVRGPYRIPNLDARMFSVVTNKVPLNVLRGAGAPQAALLMERLMDEAAHALRMDRAEIRRRNLLRPEELPLDRGETDFAGAGRIIYDEGDYPRCLSAALKLANYEDFESERASASQKGRLCGMGIAMYVEITAVGPYENARVRLQPDGTIILFSSIMPMGQGSETVQRQLVAEELGIPMEQVAVRQGDTDEVPDAIGTFASRGAAVGGAVARLAARELIKEILNRAAAHLGIARDELSWENGGITCSRLEPFIPMAEIPTRLAARNGKANDGGIEARFRLDVAHPSYAYAAHIAVVEIDPETGRIEIPRYIVAHDCGKVANPLLVEGQIVGGVVQGIGQVLREKVVYDVNGLLQTRALMDYVLPGAADLPPDFRITHMETPTRFNPFGMRGAGEGGCTGAQAAVSNAVTDALRGYDFSVEGSGPFTPTWVLEKLDKPLRIPAR